MTNLDRGFTSSTRPQNYYRQLVRALEKGVAVIERDGGVVLVDQSAAIVWRATSAQLNAIVPALLSERHVSAAAVAKLKILQQLTSANMVASLDLLTHREHQILELICSGLRDSEIADRLGVSCHTIRNHIASLYRKLRVHRRSAAVIWAYERGIAQAEQRRVED